ncbi:MAG: hypothetical protein ABS76_32985 [Pelagibacterium sp. SCN 64-44]|nr:MAG: hypothetical protein ABS76_32985 [Pelagibacterium sp. SCN 64-44]
MAERPLRILQVLRAPVGGLFRHVADLTRALAARGHSVGIVVDALANDSQTEGLLQSLEPAAALGIYRLPMPRLFGKGDLITPFAIARLARQLDIDIIHGHGAKGGFYARLALYGRTRARAFYTPHGGVLHYPASALSGRLFHRIERVLMARTSAIIFESAYAEKTYSALIGTPTCHSVIVHNGLRPEEFVAIPPGPADFVFVGELRTLKGIFPLVEAMAALPGASLVMAGDGPERAALEARIGALGLADRIRLVGSQPARQVFAMGRCVIVPSLAESLPYVVMEAAAAQLPVIATRVGGIAEIFGPTAASLVPADDPAALAAAMRGFLDDPAAAASEMRARLAHIEAKFSVEHMTDAIERLYRAGSGNMAG